MKKPKLIIYVLIGILSGIIGVSMTEEPNVTPCKRYEHVIVHDTVKVYVYDTLYNSVIDHIKSYEGFRSTPYKDNDGSLTIGYGHHLRNGENYSRIDSAFAEKLLVEDLTRCVDFVENHTSLQDNQSLAMGMLAYNCGTGRVKRYIANGLLDRIEVLPHYCHYTNSKGEKVKSSKLQERRTFELQVYTYDI